MSEQEGAFDALRGVGVFFERGEVVVVAVFPRPTKPPALAPSEGYTCLYRATYKQAPIQAVDVDRAAGAALLDYLEARRKVEKSAEQGEERVPRSWCRPEKPPAWERADYAKDD